MPRPYTQLYLHLVWSTWDRLPLIAARNEPELHAVMANEFRQLGCIPLAIGGVENHVHCLTTLPVTKSVAEIVKQVKGASSHWMNHAAGTPDAFKWQGSYGAFTVTKNAVERVREYVLHQREHHASGATWPEWERSQGDEGLP